MKDRSHRFGGRAVSAPPESRTHSTGEFRQLEFDSLQFSCDDVLVEFHPVPDLAERDHQSEEQNADAPGHGRHDIGRIRESEN